MRRVRRATQTVPLKVASTRLPSTVRVKVIVFAFSFLMRLLDGVKKPSEVRFFSILMKSLTKPTSSPTTQVLLGMFSTEVADE